MSKKRLYEIAKEVGVESKVVVAKAQELGLSVKSHSSSVEEADANRITSSLKGGTAKAESKPAPKIAPAPKKEKVTPKAEKATTSKPAPAKETVKAEAKEAPVTPKKPQSRNFKAEREARAKAEAERRQNGGGRDNRNRNRNKQGNDQGKRHNNDRRNQNGNGQGNRNNGNRDNKNNRDRNFQAKQRNDQGRNKRNDAAHNNQAGPRIDFKARAAALKAEQNAEYSRQSETRFREEKAAEQRRAKEQEKARKEKQQAQVTVQKDVAEAKPAPKPAPVVAQPAPAAQAQDTRRKKARPDKSRDNRRENEDGPKKTRNNKWNNQNQVRNQRNSNWNKNKKGKNNRGNSAQKPVTERKFHELPKEFEYTEGMTVAEIAKRIKREPAEIVKKLFMMGVMATQNQSLDGDTIELLMVDYGIEATKKEEVDNADIERFFIDEDYLNKDAMVERAPVVTIMGHVDHGKTTLLDTLRNSRVATGEAGGITQHIGAYQIEEGGKKITFLDTPGHAAFTSMRARGASVTDITILIVAADDGVMPQTIEAINHSKAAGVPIIVAINKIDKPGANPERVIGELAEHGVISTAWGGDSEFVEISAKFGQNIEELLETVLLVAEVEELKADPTVRAIGTVIEARLDKGKGAVATLLVQQGTLNVQDPIVVGNTFGRVRAMTNDLGRRIKTAAPSTPVSITGLNEAPMAGDHFAVYEDEKAARAAGEERAKRALMKQRQQTHRVSLDNLFDTLKAGEMKTVNVIIKADVQGSVEALAASLLKIDVEGVRVNVVHSAVGAINESDITLAEASDAVVIGFNVRPTPQARQQAETDEVEIRLHSIIYKVIEEIEDAMKGMLDPEFEEKILGEAIIRETFKVSKVGTIGGFMVTSGKITRESSARVIRDGVVIFDGKLASLKHFKDDVKEVGNAQEGGLMIENYNDIKVDDVIEAYIMEEIKR
ncbi:translation initiation factor IF-2 [uncultured Streptococcus sp.]|uniref:translation initiation factor IF-2 n=1 Tax=uncultured Streptococcus sp. TaxID=83427 RepID=UPI0028D69982|nr:translation initiation factor IF-2 [uncultured Streptococcus sp.]